MSDSGKRLKRAQEGESNSIRSERAKRGEALMDCVLSCFFNMGLECGVPSIAAAANANRYGEGN